MDEVFTLCLPTDLLFRNGRVLFQSPSWMLVVESVGLEKLADCDVI